MMLPLTNSRVYLAIGSTDMRKAINGLSIMVEQMVCLLQKELFGRKSEKHVLPDHEQRQLFDPIEALESDRRIFEEKIVIPEHALKKRGRKPLPANLPRVDVVHDLPEEEKQCDCGATLSCIGQDVSEKLD